MQGEKNFDGAKIIRFPIELAAKPTTELLRDLAPGADQVSLIAEAFGLDEPDAHIREGADRGMAECIAAQDWPQDKAERRAALEELLKPLIEHAVRLCRKARAAGLRSDEAAGKLVSARIEGGYWLDALEDAVDARAFEWANSLLDAYEAAQEMFGAERAVGFAIRGEPWRPFNLDDEVEVALFSAARR